MERKFVAWFSIALAPGIILGIAVNNFTAGMALGIVGGLLLAMVQTSLIKNEKYEQDL